MSTPTIESMMATIADLVAMAPRATGTPGGEAAAEYVANRFRNAGLSEVGFEEATTYAWESAGHRLVVGEHEIDSRPIRHCWLPDHEWTGGRDTGAGLTAEVVDIGAKAPGEYDVRGKIVLFDLVFEMTLASMLPLTEYIHDPGRRMLNKAVMRSTNPYITSLTRVMQQAADGGAVGLIGVLRDYPDSVNYHNEYYRKTLLSLPGVWVTRRSGDQIRRALAEGAEITLHLAVSRREATAKTVIGFIDGDSTETIMIQTHHDSIGPGAVEDGSGVSEVVALAEYYGAKARAGWRPAKTLMFATFDTHFTDYRGHQAFCRKWILDEQTRHRIVLNLTIEHIGLRAIEGADGGFEVTDMTEPRGFFENVAPGLKWRLIRSIRKHGLYAASLVNASPLEFGAMGIPTDASFVLVSGVPVISLVSGPLYLYDDADTLDKVDQSQLVPVALTFIDLIEAALTRSGNRMGLIPGNLRRRLPRGRW